MNHLVKTKKELNARFKSRTFLKLMNLKLLSLKDDRATLSFDCNSDTVSLRGTLYGGVVAFAADVGIWAALVSEGLDQLVVTTDLNVHYLDRFEKGKVTVRAAILRRGKNMIIGEARLYNHKKILAAHVTGSFIRL